MRFEGTFKINISRKKVWNFISDPRSAARYVPGIKKLEVQAPDKFTAQIKLGIGWIKGTFDFKFTIMEQNPPTYARLSAHGFGAKSEIDFDATVVLADISKEATMLSWKADVIIHGLLAQIGQRLLSSVAKKIANQIFENIKNELESEVIT